MTKIIVARNVNDALPQGIAWLHEHGIIEESRVGRVLVSPTPVITEYQMPWERVLFNPVRDANPFFHFFESLWMLAGRNDVEFPAYYAANIASFSDDGVTVAGAYGNRWRIRFGIDQLKVVKDELRKNPKSRRCVVAMWDPFGAPTADEDGKYREHEDDLMLATGGGKDVPCNTHLYFDTIGGRLNMTVSCRSNDAVWGCYGANAVHFSFLHSYMACATGIEQGVYRQFSNNFHVYMDRPDVQRLMGSDGVVTDDGQYYQQGHGVNMLFRLPETESVWLADLGQFFGAWSPRGMLHKAKWSLTPFFRTVVTPLVNAHHLYKVNAFDEAFNELAACESVDWRLAATQWLHRRQEARNAKQN